MPTPSTLAADVATASLAKIAEGARETTAQEMLNKREDEHPGEGWRASAWLTTHNLAELVAKVLMSPLADLAGNSSAELAFFRAFSHEGSRDLLLTLLTNADIATILADELWPRFVALAQPGAASAGELHAKFVEEGSGFDLEYAGLKNFFGGLEAVVGAPNPNVLSGMRREHCNEVDSIEPFITPNYKMQTTTRIEWWFVEDPKAGLSELKLESWPVEAPEMIKGSARGRVPLPVSAFDSAFGEVNAKLTELSMPTILVEEFLGCRMYTGPCFVKYNTVLRGLQSSIPFFRDKFTDLCKGNKYTTSLHVINSAVVKLSKLTIAEKVYRGVSGGRLPRNFRHANEYGVRGGVDPAFMSTTLDREVAMTYAGSSSGPGVVFSIQQGMVDRGADIGWLSQYPHEKEILFAPLGSLEIQKLNVEGTVLVPEVRLSINLNAATIEQVIGRRRKLLREMGSNMAVEVSAALSGSGFEESSVQMLNEQLEKEALSRESMWYNDEDNFKTGVDEVIHAKRSALAHEKRLAWLLLRPKDLAAHDKAIVKLLHDHAAAVRRAALEALAHLEPTHLSPHAKALVPLLRDGDESVRSAAVETFGRVSPAALGTEAPSIALVLEHATQQPYVRRAAVMALAKLEAGKLAQYAAPIVQRSTDAHGFVRRAVIDALGGLLPVALLPHVNLVLQRLEDAEEDVRYAAVTTLGRVAPELSKGHIDAVIRRTQHALGGVRASALTLLGKLASSALAERASVLVTGLKDPEPHVRTVALDVLSRLEPSDLAAHTAALVIGLKDEAPEVRTAAVVTMGNLDKAVLADHLHEVVLRLSDHDKEVRSAAVGTLFRKLDVTELSAHVEQVVERIEDKDGAVRRSAAQWARSKLDPNLLGKHASAIAGGLDDTILSVRRASLEALSLMDPGILAKFAPMIIDRLDDEILSVRRSAVAALMRLYPSDLQQHTPGLLKALRDPEWSVRAAVVETLGKLPPEHLAQHAINPHLLDAIEDAFDGVRTAAVGVLGGLRPNVLREHSAAVAHKIEHPKGAVRIAAITILDSLDSVALAAHSKELLKLLDPPGDSNKFVRAGALAVLAKLPTETLAPHASTFLRYVEHDEDEHVLAAALDALTKADPEGKLLQSAPGLVQSKQMQVKHMAPAAHATPMQSQISPLRKQGSMAHSMAASSSSIPIAPASTPKAPSAAHTPLSSNLTPARHGGAAGGAPAGAKRSFVPGAPLAAPSMGHS